MTQSPDIAGGPVTTLQAGRFGARIPAGVKKNFSLPNRPERLRRPPNLLLNGYRDFFVKVKRQRSAKVKNHRSYTSIPPTCPQGVDEDN